MIACAEDVLTDADSAFFERNGYVILRNFYALDDVDAIKRGIHRLVETLGPQMLPDFVPEPYTADRFDQGIIASLNSRREFASRVYDAIKKLPSYVKLAFSPRHEIVAARLLNTDFVGSANRGYGMRMDVPFEDHTLTQLHQDFVTQLCSPAGVVFWSPLRDIVPEAGPLRIYPGSHHHGIFPIQKRTSGSQGLVIRDETAVRAKFNARDLLPRAGDVIVTHQLLLHESSPNRSQNVRWSMISRYFNFLDPEGVRIKWVGGLQEGHSFESLYPELSDVVPLVERESS